MKFLRLIFLAHMLQGCATEAVMRIGDLNEAIVEYKGYQAAYADDNALVVRYQTDLSHEKWANIALGSFNHVPIASLNQQAIDRSDLIVECSAPHTKPLTSLPPQIPLYQHYSLSDMKNDKAPLSAYASRYNLTLLRRNSTHPEEVAVKTIGVSPCPYHEPWAPYVRAALLPFSVVIDIISSPFVAFSFFSTGDAPWC